MKLLSYITWLAGAAFTVYMMLDSKEKVGIDKGINALGIWMVAGGITLCWMVAGIYFFYSKQAAAGKYALLVGLIQFVLMIGIAMLMGHTIKIN